MTKTIRNEILTMLMILPLLTAGISMGFIQNSYAATIEPEEVNLEMEPGETILVSKEITFEGQFAGIGVAFDQDCSLFAGFVNVAFPPNMVTLDERFSVPEATPPGDFHCEITFIIDVFGPGPEPVCDGQQINPFTCIPSWTCNGRPIGPILQPCPPEIQQFRVTQTIWITVPEPLIEVDIDVKPGSDPSSVNCKNLKGNVPVAIFGAENFDATTIDIEIVSMNLVGLDPIQVFEVHNELHIEDLNDDGFDDAVLHLDKAEVCTATATAPLKETVVVELTGETTDETQFIGIGDIRIVKR